MAWKGQEGGPECWCGEQPVNSSPGTFALSPPWVPAALREDSSVQRVGRLQPGWPSSCRCRTQRLRDPAVSPILENRKRRCPGQPLGPEAE